MSHKSVFLLYWISKSKNYYVKFDGLFLSHPVVCIVNSITYLRNTKQTKLSNKRSQQLKW